MPKLPLACQACGSLVFRPVAGGPDKPLVVACSVCGLEITEKLHPTDDEIEEFFFGRGDVEAIGKHLLDCDSCALRACYIEAGRQMLRLGCIEFKVSQN